MRIGAADHGFAMTKERRLELQSRQLPDRLVGFSHIGSEAGVGPGDATIDTVAVNRNGTTQLNSPTGFKLKSGDNAVVVAESPGTFSPLDSALALAGE